MNNIIYLLIKMYIFNGKMKNTKTVAEKVFVLKLFNSINLIINLFQIILFIILFNIFIILYLKSILFHYI